MPNFSMKVVNGQSFARRMKQRSQKVQKNVLKAVRVAATETRNTAINSILQNPRAGGTVTRYDPLRSIRRAQAGDAPASDTGFLASNIFLAFKNQGLLAEVESKADYSASLEFGTLHMRARPFLQPALEQGRRKYERLFTKAVKDAI